MAEALTVGVPAFAGRRLLYVGTGSIQVAFMPFWVNWLRLCYSDLEVRIVVSRSAERFVSRSALAPLSGREVLLDAWPDDARPTALHVELQQWADTVLVMPATMHTVARYALGLADTPMLLALQCTTAPVVVAPALPPGGADAPSYRRHRDLLLERGNVAVVDPQPIRSTTTGRMDAAAASNLPDAIEAVEAVRARVACRAHAA